MPDHIAAGHPAIPCLRDRGFPSCPICDRITPGAPGYSSHYYRLFHADEFDDPTPAQHVDGDTLIVDNPPEDYRDGPTVPLAAQLANIARMKSCPHWRATSECGCGMNRCLAGKGREGDGAVSHRDCFSCLGIPT